MAPYGRLAVGPSIRNSALPPERGPELGLLGALGRCGGILSCMAATRRETPLHALKRRKPVPFEFVLDALSPLETATHPMFGCLAIYVGRKIVLILRDKLGQDPDNGVWLATTCEHHESLRLEFPNMRSIGAFGPAVTGWQVLPADAPDFEESAMRACELVIAGDPRIGKVPKSKKPRKGHAKA